MSRGFDIPQFKTFWQYQEEDNARQWKNIVIEFDRFRNRINDSQVLFINPVSDPDFRIGNIKREGSYMIMDGIDANDNQSRIIQHMSQLSFRMTIAEAASGTKGAFGFIQPKGEPTEAS